jgi:hypothetical protein
LTQSVSGGICSGMSSGESSLPDPVSGAIAGHTPSHAEDAMRLLTRETRVSPGCVPRQLAGRPIPSDTSFLDGDSYVLRTDTGLAFFYRKGEGITTEHEPDADLTDEGLWLNGSIYAAVACINGLMPIHASAVAHGGRVYAFTGPSGAGKSTLIAALAGHGLPMYCDDTLVLDLSDPERVFCLPGHKRLKLTPEAIALTGVAAQESVGAETGKFYADATARPMLVPLPLAELIFLETGNLETGAATMTPLTGGARIARLGDDHYTTDLFNQAQNRGRAEIFAVRARLARQVSMSCLVRPRDTAHFAQSARLAARFIDKRSTELTAGHAHHARQDIPSA